MNARIALGIFLRLFVILAMAANPMAPLAVAAVHVAAANGTPDCMAGMAMARGMPVGQEMSMSDPGHVHHMAGMAMPSDASGNGCPDHCCHHGQCDMSTCLAHCSMAAVDLRTVFPRVPRSSVRAFALATSVPDPPPKQQLRPPIC